MKKYVSFICVAIPVLVVYFSIHWWVVTSVTNDFSSHVPVRYPDYQLSSESVSFPVYKVSLELTNGTTSLLGGLVYKVQELDLTKTAIVSTLCLVLLIFSAVIFLLHPSARPAIILFLLTVWSFQVFTILRVSAGWDEFFVNLKHAYNLANHGLYSFNVHTMEEASVDFLPLIIVGLLGLLTGLDLTDLALMMSILGGMVCTLIAFLIFRKYKAVPLFQVAGTICIAFFPSFNWISGSGFTANLFGSFFLLVFYFLSLSSRTSYLVALIIASIMPLIRVEAIIFCFLFLFLLTLRSFFRFGSSVFTKRRWWLYFASRGLLLALPFILLSVWRLFSFGSMFPSPVYYKEATGHAGYFWLGLKQLLQIITGYRIPILMLLFGYPLWQFSLKYLRKPKFVSYFLSLALFSIVYFASGGDWFPAQWARYLVPALLVYFVVVFVSLSHFYVNLTANYKRYVFLLFLLVGSLGSIFWAKQDNMYLDAITDYKNTVNRWERMERLSALGNFFYKTIPAKSVIASSELASVMYYAQRDAFGLLGFANLGLAKADINPLISSPIIARKRNPEIVTKAKPDVIFFFEPIIYIGNNRSRDVVEGSLAGHQFAVSHESITHYILGSYQSLKQQGYNPVVAIVDPYVVVYWVNQKIYDEHMSNLSRAGATLQYEINRRFESHENIYRRYGDFRSP